MATLIKVDGTEIEVTPERGRFFGLKEMQAMVATGQPLENTLIEISRCPTEDDRAQVLIVNESGLLLDLPVNEKATKIYRDTHYSSNCIVGDVLLAHTVRTMDGDEIGI